MVLQYPTNEFPVILSENGLQLFVSSESGLLSKPSSGNVCGIKKFRKMSKYFPIVSLDRKAFLQNS
jgi:hypothetical protein